MTRNTTPNDSRDVSVEKQVDVDLDPEVWRAIQERAQECARGSTKDPETAFWDAIHEIVELTPNLVVDGDVKGIEDVPGLADMATSEEA